MIKKEITFKDLDGKEVTDTFWFHLYTADVAKMELKQKGGLGAYLKKIVADDNGEAIINSFEEILRLSYGIRGADNREFEKSPEISRHFMNTDAYSVLFMELVTDAEASAAFINGVVPADIAPNRDTPVLPERLLPKEEFHLESVGPDVHGMGTVEKVSPAEVTAQTAAMTLDEMRAAIRKAEENNK